MKNIYVCLDNLRSLYNIGAIFRTCSFFGVYNVILLGYSGKNLNQDGGLILHKEILKTSLDSEKDLNLTFLDRVEDLIGFARNLDLKIVSIEQSAASVKFNEWVPEKNMVIVFGNEVEGVQQKIINISDLIVEIEKIGKHNSLNVTTTCGVVLNKVANINRGL